MGRVAGELAGQLLVEEPVWLDGPAMLGPRLANGVSGAENVRVRVAERDYPHVHTPSMHMSAHAGTLVCM